MALKVPTQMIKNIDLTSMIGQQVRVYRNLHNKMFSVQCRSADGWRVAGHVAEISLCEVSFKVSQAGRDRVLTQKKKNVHAFVVGHVTDASIADGQLVSYNPYLMGSFYIKETKEAIKSCQRARVSGTGIIAQ